jgi:putative transposase
VEALIDELDPPKGTGRPRNDPRKTLDAIVFRMRSGCQCNQLPAELGDDSSAHRWFQRWRRVGLWDRLWGTLVEHCDALGAVQWEWQAADGAMGKARMGGGDIGRNPTDRGKNGTKKSLLVEGQGGPLGIVTAGAHVHDVRLLRPTLEAIIVERPPPLRVPQHLCLDKAYDSPRGHLVTLAAGYLPHIRPVGEQRQDPKKPRHPPRRWVVERTLSWLSKCRGLLCRYEKNPDNYLALLKLACALLWYRRCWHLAQAG